MFVLGVQNGHENASRHAMFRLRTSQQGLDVLSYGRPPPERPKGRRSLVPPNQRPARYVVRGGGLGPGPNMTVPPLLVAHGGAVPVFIVAYYASALLHEAVHILAACLVGAQADAFGRAPCGIRANVLASAGMGEKVWRDNGSIPAKAAGS